MVVMEDDIVKMGVGLMLRHAHGQVELVQGAGVHVHL